MKKLKTIAKSFIKTATKSLIFLLYRIIYPKTHRQPSGKIDPKRILLLNGAHIGDVVISTSIIPILRSAYPSCEIGFLVGSWSSMIVSNHPDIAFVHCIDHWLLNRSQKTLIGKFFHYLKTRKIALTQIRETKYDLALCIFPYFLPDFMNLAWRAKIPVRLGFRQSLFACMATTTVDIQSNYFLHQSILQAEVLKPLLIGDMHSLKRRSVLAESPNSAISEVLSLLRVNKILGKKYCIIHIGSGAANRELSIEFWRTVAISLINSYTLLFTGKGSIEFSNITHIIDGLDNCINACDELSWDGFVSAVRHAEKLYGVESMAGHVAAAVGTPCVVVYSAVAGVARWRPDGELVTVFTNHLACAPCGNVNGCNKMACLRNVKPFDILQ